MKRLLLLGCLISATCLQAMPVSLRCPCCPQPKDPEAPGEQEQNCYFLFCECGGAGGESCDCR